MSIRIDKAGRVTTVAIERPEARNAVDPETARALAKAFHDFEADDTADIGVLAGAYMQSKQPERREGLLARRLLRHAAALGSQVEADFASYLLFDGGFAELLIELGRHDAIARTEEIRAFFGQT